MCTSLGSFKYDSAGHLGRYRGMLEYYWDFPERLSMLLASLEYSWKLKVTVRRYLENSGRGGWVGLVPFYFREHWLPGRKQLPEAGG